MIKDNLADSNLDQEVKEYDHKKMKLTKDEREELPQEFQKKLSKGVLY